MAEPAYTIEVIYAHSPTPVERHHAATAAEALAKIKELLEAHPECHRLIAMMGTSRLFAVDCKGARIP